MSGVRLSPLRRTVAILPATVLAATTIVACGSGAPGRVADRVLLFGDSLLWQSADEVSASLSSRGWDVDAIRAAPGATIEGPPSVDWAAVMVAETEGRRPGTVIIELGTNGCGPECPSIDDTIDDTMTRFREIGRVVWVGVRLDAPIPENPRETNAALQRAADRWPNLEYVALEGAFDDPALVSGDDIHFTDAGEQRFAELIAAALGRPPAT